MAASDGAFARWHRGAWKNDSAASEKADSGKNELDEKYKENHAAAYNKTSPYKDDVTNYVAGQKTKLQNKEAKLQAKKSKLQAEKSNLQAIREQYKGTGEKLSQDLKNLQPAASNFKKDNPTLTNRLKEFEIENSLQNPSSG